MRAEALSISISENMEPYIYTMSDGKSIAEKAAELAGESIWDFVETLKKYNVPWGEYTEDGLRMDKSID